MLFELALGAGATMAGGFAIAKGRRGLLYRRLARRIAAITGSRAVHIAAFPERLPGFENRFAVIPDVLESAALQALRTEAERLADAERSYVPTHKQGGTVAYEALIAAAPKAVSLYHAPVFQGLISRLCGEAIRPTPIQDQSSLSLLCYTKPGDHIGWHYDHNFYRGRHFTVLLPLVNEGHAESGLSHARLIVKLGEEEHAVASPPNTLIVFEGAKVRHKLLPIVEGERRIVLSMTYCTDPSASLAQGIARRVKDVAFFGPRALWT
jgi:hypothetical protein